MDILVWGSKYKPSKFLYTIIMQRKKWTSPLCIGGLEIDPSRFETLAQGM